MEMVEQRLMNINIYARQIPHKTFDEINETVTRDNFFEDMRLIELRIEKMVNDYFGNTEIDDEPCLSLDDGEDQWAWTTQSCYITYNITKQADLNDWCKTNCHGKWYFKFKACKDLIVFEKETDAALFKLLYL